MRKRLIVKKNKVNIIPLIDIIFLMLVFFMLATNFSEHKEINFSSDSKKETINKTNENKIFVIKIIENEYIVKGKKILVEDIEESYLKKWASLSFKKVVVMGSVGCKISSILRGESDIYISLSLPGKSAPKDWDFAAPEAILKAGGGAITNLYNRELDYMNSKFEQRGIIIASNNKQTHGKVCSKIKEIIAINDLYPFS